MKRRDFVKNTLPVAITLPSLLNGLTVKAFASHFLFDALLNVNNETDRVLVMIQLSGGNDGLNTVIPIELYSNYFNARNNVAIPQNSVLSLNNNIKMGLHPSMTGMQQLYNNGMLSILQAVGYPNPNFSHFRATDIWMSASDSNVNVPSGWAGRYLNTQYSGYPNGYPNGNMPDPLAIQIGSFASLAFQGPAVNMALSVSNASSFYNLINGVQDTAPNTPAGKELTYIRDVARQTNQYGTAIVSAYNNVAQQSTYPNTNLANQLKIVARLIKGGLKTRLYMVSMGGFDTHSLQVNTTDTTTGSHANLLLQLSDAVKAFNDDLQYLQIQDRVLGMTFSEFGRRIKSNSSLGTDHGAAAPMFLFGSQVLGGVIGDNPPIPSAVTVNDNIPMQYDFRSVYASVLAKWFCADDTVLNTSLLNNFQTLPLLKTQQCSTPPPPPSDDLLTNYPNPFSSTTTIKFKTNGGHTVIQIIDSIGRVIANIGENTYAPGTYTVEWNSNGLSSGVYYARLQNGSISQVRSMLKLR